MSSDNEDLVPEPVPESDSDPIPVCGSGSGRGTDWSSIPGYFESQTEYNKVLDTNITVTSWPEMQILYSEYYLIFLRNEHFVEKHFVK